MGGQGHAAVGDRDVDARSAGETAHDGLLVDGERADADLELHGPGRRRGRGRCAGRGRGVHRPSGAARVLGCAGPPAAAASSASRWSRPPGCGRRARPGVCSNRTGPGEGDRADGGSPGRARPSLLALQGTSGHIFARGGRPAAGAADHLVRLQDFAIGGANPRRRARLQAGDAAGLAGADIRAVPLRVRDQAGDQRFGQQVALTGEERGGRRLPADGTTAPAAVTSAGSRRRAG